MNQLLLDITSKFKVDIILPLNLVNFEKAFDLKNEITDIEVKEDPLDLDFCKNIALKYADDKINSTVNLLESYEWLF